MKIIYRVLWLRIVVMADKPQTTWPMMPVGVLFCKNGDPAIDNSFIEFSPHTTPPLPVMLMFITHHIGADFCLPGKRLEDVAVNPLYRNEYELRGPQVKEIDDGTAEVGKELFRILIREDKAHQGRQHLFRIRYRLEHSHEPPFVTCYG